MAHRSSDGVRNAAYIPDSKNNKKDKLATNLSSNRVGDVTWKRQNPAAASSDLAPVPVLSEEEARDALLSMVKKSCCWGENAAKRMSINKITPTCSYHYVLDTFTEGRSTCRRQVPYKREPVDGPHDGPAHGLWDTPCKPTALFKSIERKLTVPHTDIVLPCSRCSGKGSLTCGECESRGSLKCYSCRGKGKKKVSDSRSGENEKLVNYSYYETCSSCNGCGNNQCYSCGASGRITCRVCEGYCSLKNFTQLTVAFTNRHNDHIVEKSDLPKELIRGVQGDTIFEQTQLRVNPLKNFSEPEINQRSKDLLQIHGRSWPTDRVLQQRHYLRAVPVYRCQFEYSGKPGRFWVYGQERRVYTTDYPHTCCCCRCTIL